MLTFDERDNRFTYRTIAVCLHRNRVLLQTAESDEFWALPGGRVEHGESAYEAIVREMNEELAIDTVHARPIWVVDNIFSYKGKNCHELGIYFEFAGDPTSYIYESDKFPGVENETDLLFEWFDIESLNTIELYPKFLTESLLEIPAETQYICHRDA